MLQYKDMPLEAFAFLGAVLLFLIILIIFFLYLNKMLCFSQCGGFPCIEQIPVKDSGKCKLGNAYNYDSGDTSSDSDDEVLRRYQKSIQASGSSQSLRGSQRSSTASATKPTKPHRSKHTDEDADARLVSLAEQGRRQGSSRGNDDIDSRHSLLEPDVTPGQTPTHHSDEDSSKGLPQGERSRPDQTGTYDNTAFDNVEEIAPRVDTYGDAHSARSGGSSRSPTNTLHGSSITSVSVTTEEPDRCKVAVSSQDMDNETMIRDSHTPGVASGHKSTIHSSSESSEGSDLDPHSEDDVPDPKEVKEHMFDVSDLQDREPVLISKCGSLEVTFAYDRSGTGKMTITVHAAKDIPTKERGGSNHNQIRMLLLPNKKVRHKTKIKSGDDPSYEETFVFKVPEEDADQMGVRFRLYGCERMRRERMIGECVVGFASLNLDIATTHLLSLEPRSNLSHGDSKLDVSSLARSDSASSTQSMQHGGMPELLIGLSYNGTTGRLSTEVIKGSNFRNMAMNRAPDTYVKLTLMSPNGQEIARSKTSIRRGQPHPLFKETFMFQVALFQLPDVTLMVSVYNKRSMKRKEMIGWFSLGYNNSGDEETAHWTDMRESKGEQVCRWHVLLEA